MSVATASVRVPLVDLAPSHDGLAGRIIDDIGDLIGTGAFTNGPAVGEFEQAFAAYCRVADAVGVGSGIAALRLGLQAAGVGAGDEVVIPAHTFVATAEAVSQAGARPVLVDVADGDGTMDPAAVRAAVSSRTRVLLPVHLYGHMADMRALTDVAATAGAMILEDACQAHGAERDGIAPGMCSLAAAFSFYPGKNLGAFGDAGAIVSGDVCLAARVRAMREHGQTAKYHHAMEGDTARLDTIQALVLLRKLPLLDTWNAQRRRAAEFYADALDGVGDLRLPVSRPGSTPVWHLYVVRTRHRDALAAFLAERGIGTGCHYPQPVHLTPAYAHLAHPRGSFPVAEQIARTCLSLPLFPGITPGQLDAVAGAVAAYYAHAA